MGLDPNDDTFPPGAVCLNCNDPLFGGVTPANVLVNFKDIVVCPGKFPASSAPNQTFTLPQVDTCKWQVFEGPYQVFYDLAGANAKLFVQAGLAFWFFGTSGAQCDDEFTNDLNCVAPNAWSDTGSATIFWGPQVGKQPIS